MQTKALLRHRYPYLGNMNIMTLAYVGRMEDFLEHVAYQRVLGLEWKGGLEGGTHTLHILAFTIFPFLAPLAISPECKLKHPPAHTKGEMFHQRLQDYWHSVLTYFTTPTTVFTMDAMAYLALVGLHSYCTLEPFDEVRTTEADLVLLVWIIAMILDEVKQMDSAGGIAFWWSSGWNK